MNINDVKKFLILHNIALFSRIEKIDNDNEKLKAKLEDVRRRRSIREKKDEELRNPPTPEVKQERRNIPGIINYSSTSVNFL